VFRENVSENFISTVQSTTKLSNLLVIKLLQTIKQLAEKNDSHSRYGASMGSQKVKRDDWDQPYQIATQSNQLQK